MFQFLETIKIKNNEIHDIEFHQKRVDRTFKDFYNSSSSLNLLESISINSNYNNIHKCRFLYNENNYKIEFIPYSIKDIEKVKLVEDNSINYNYKFINRDNLNKLKNINKEYDDIIIVKNGLITDSSYANLLFFNGSSWITPNSPLLAGTKREKLLNDKVIIEDKICINDLKSFSKFMFVNAMLDFDLNRALPIDIIG